MACCARLLASIGHLRRFAIPLLLLLPGLAGPPVLGAAPATTGTVIATVTDANGDVLPGACFEVESQAGGFAGFGCDIFAKAGGTTTISGLAPGVDSLALVYLPRDYLFPPNRAITVVAGQTSRVALTLQTAGDSIAIATVDDQGTPKWGACYAVFRDTGAGQPGASAGQGCDRYDGTNDGSTTIGGLTNGRYLVVQSVPPPGYAVAPAQTVTITADRDQALTVTVKQGGGFVMVSDVDNAQDTVAGACFRVYAAAGHGALGPLVTLACDYADGANDGRTRLGGLAAGRYLLVQPRAVPGHARAANVTFTIGTADDPDLVVLSPSAATEGAPSNVASQPAPSSGPRASHASASSAPPANPCRFVLPGSSGQLHPVAERSRPHAACAS